LLRKPTWLHACFCLSLLIKVMDKNQIPIYKWSVLQTYITYKKIDIKVLLHFKRNLKTEIVNRWKTLQHKDNNELLCLTLRCYIRLFCSVALIKKKMKKYGELKHFSSFHFARRTMSVITIIILILTFKVKVTMSLFWYPLMSETKNPPDILGGWNKALAGTFGYSHGVIKTYLILSR